MTLLELTTAARVKADALLKHSGAGNDAYIATLVSSVSAHLSRWMGYDTLLNATYTEEYDVPPRWGRVLYTRHAPISSITSIKSRSALSVAWADVTALDTDFYAIEDAEIPARVVIEDGTIYTGNQRLQVIYVAGFATSTANLISSYPDIAEAADKQIVEEFNRRNHPGQGTLSFDGSVDFAQGALKLLPGVKERLAPYRRYRFGGGVW